MATPRQPRTFISYSRVNQEFAVRLARELKAAGFSVWLDQLDIPAGVRWDDEIERVLRECRIFVAILTPAFIESENAKDEIGYAIDRDKRILPVLLEKCEIPLRLSRFQYVDFTRLSYREGVGRAKELLAQLEREETAAAPARNSPSVKSRERPTQPSKARAAQGKPRSRKAVSPSPPDAASRQRTSRPIAVYLGLAALALIVLFGAAGLILGGFTPAGETPTGTPTARIDPTATPRPTSTAVPDTPTLAPQGFYIEEFDAPTLDWLLFASDGEQREHSRAVQDGKLVIHVSDATSLPFAAYLINEAFDYTAVRVEAVVNNTGNNANGFSLICNYSESGWYEFRISSNGNYQIFAFGPGGSVPQGGFELENAGSEKIIPFGATNTFAAICTEDQLTLEINGEPEITTDARYNLPAGDVGIGFSAPGDFSVDLEFESFSVSQP